MAAATEKRLEDATAAERKELVKDSVSQLVGLYGITMAALLVLFVEQKCGPTAANPTVHQCTLEEDYNDLYEKAVLALNFLCLLVFVAANAIFWLRERFIIDHFSQDPDQPEDALPEELTAYPPFLDKLRKHNSRAYYAAEFMFVILLINFAVSSAVIVGKHYAGRTTIVGLLSNTFLCMMKIWSYRSIAKQCRTADSATSLFESANKILNTVADDKKFLPGVYDPESAKGGSKGGSKGAHAGGQKDGATGGPGSRASATPSPAPSAGNSSSRSSGSSRGSSRATPLPPPPPRELERRGGRRKGAMR